MASAKRVAATAVLFLVTGGQVAACGESFTSSGSGGAGGATSTSTSTSGTAGSGGESSSGTGGATSSSTTSTGTAGGAPGVEVPCATETCKNGRACCIWPADPNLSFCASPGQCGSYLEATCNELSDCGPGQVCCMVITGGVDEHQISCVTNCTGDLVCTGDSSICADGDSCVVAGALPAGYEVCLSPTDV